MRLVVLNLKVKHFKRVKLVKVVEVSGRVGLHFFKEGCDVSLILKRQFKHSLADGVFVEVELELDIGDVIARLGVIHQASVLCQFEIVSNFLSHVFTCANVVLLDPISQLGKTASSSEPADNLVRSSKEDVDKAPTHSKMIVLKCIPLGLCNDFVGNSRAHTDLVTVELSCKAIAVLVPHLVLLCSNHRLSTGLNTFDESVCVGRISHALEELDAFLTFKLLKFAVLLDEVLLVY